MKQSYLSEAANNSGLPGPRTDEGGGLHVAIIMDGNGRWATSRGRPRVFGHRAGAQAVRRAVEVAPDFGIGTLTLYAFSSDNWKRPRQEVSALMLLFREYLTKQTAECREKGVRISVIGRRDRLSPDLVDLIEETEAATAHCRTLHLRIAVDYSARDAILRAAERLHATADISRERFQELLAEVLHVHSAPDVDLLIRTGGEQRLSDFLLWECAYAELYFTARMWPDFDASDLETALRSFTSRERRFGQVLEPAV